MARRRYHSAQKGIDHEEENRTIRTDTRDIGLRWGLCHRLYGCSNHTTNTRGHSNEHTPAHTHEHTDADEHTHSDTNQYTDEHTDPDLYTAACPAHTDLDPCLRLLR